MVDRLKPYFAPLLLAAIGFGVSFAQPVSLVLAIAAPAIALRQPTRRTAFLAAACYYGTASWAVLPAAAAFLGALIAPVLLWLLAAGLLASPWVLFWSPHRHQLWLRIPLALTVSIIPPLGIIGWASPLTAAGLLFPAMGWLGLAANGNSREFDSRPAAPNFCPDPARNLSHEPALPRRSEPAAWLASDQHALRRPRTSWPPFRLQACPVYFRQQYRRATRECSCFPRAL